MPRRDDVSGTTVCRVVDGARGEYRVSIARRRRCQTSPCRDRTQAAWRHNKRFLLAHPCLPAPLCLNLSGGTLGGRGFGSPVSHASAGAAKTQRR